jgi:transcriptional repressor NrdR
MVMRELRKVDQVAYVRFASVYRDFKDLTEFMDEIRPMLKGSGRRGAKKKSK